MQFFISFNLYRIETPSLPSRQSDWLPTFLPFFFFLGLDLEPGLTALFTTEPQLPHTSSTAQSVLLLTFLPTGLIGVYSILTASGYYMMVLSLVRLSFCRVVIRCKGLVWFGLHIFGRNVPWPVRSPYVGACHEICTVNRDVWSAGSDQICTCEAVYLCVLMCDVLICV